MEEIKFTQEELDSIAAIQAEYQNKVSQFGQLRLEQLLLEQKSEELDTVQQNLVIEFSKLQATERELVKALNEKYGTGTLNPQTGVFTPTVSTQI